MEEFVERFCSCDGYHICCTSVNHASVESLPAKAKYAMMSGVHVAPCTSHFGFLLAPNIFSTLYHIAWPCEKCIYTWWQRWPRHQRIRIVPFGCVCLCSIIQDGSHIYVACIQLCDLAFINPKPLWDWSRKILHSVGCRCCQFGCRREACWCLLGNSSSVSHFHIHAASLSTPVLYLRELHFLC